MVEDDPDGISSFGINLTAGFAGTSNERGDAFSCTGKCEITGLDVEDVFGMEEVCFLRFLSLGDDEQSAAVRLCVLQALR